MKNNLPSEQIQIIDAFKLARKHMGVNQEAFAGLLGYSRAQVAAIECGQKLPSAIKLIKVINMVRLSPP